MDKEYARYLLDTCTGYVSATRLANRVTGEVPPSRLECPRVEDLWVLTFRASGHSRWIEQVRCSVREIWYEAIHSSTATPKATCREGLRSTCSEFLVLFDGLAAETGAHPNMEEVPAVYLRRCPASQQRSGRAGQSKTEI